MIQLNSQKYRVRISLLFAVLLVLTACGGEEAYTPGGQRATAEAEATQAVLNESAAAVRAVVELPQYCTDHPERCIVTGSADAPVTIFEFSDYGCPACAAFNTNTLLELNSYIETGEVQLVKMPTAILTNSNGSLQTPTSPQAVLCANEQGGGSDYHSILFSDQTAHTDRTNREFTQLAEDLGLNGDEFNSCLTGGSYAEATRATAQLGIDLGVQSTPTLFVNGQIVRGSSWPPLQGAIQNVLSQ